MSQIFWVFAILACMIAGFMDSNAMRCFVAASLMAIAWISLWFSGRRLGKVEEKQEPPPEILADNKVSSRIKKKLYKKYDELMHKYMTLKTLSENQQSINCRLDTELTRMQDVMRYIIRFGTGLPETEANELIGKVKTDNIDGAALMNYLSEIIRAKAAKRRKRQRKTILKPSQRIIDLS